MTGTNGVRARTVLEELYGNEPDSKILKALLSELRSENGIASSAVVNGTEHSPKPQLVFISHSSKDKEAVMAFVEFLFCIGLNKHQVFCTSYPECGLPLGKEINDRIGKIFRTYNLHVISLLSENYYKSPICLNEMGAAWGKENHKWTGILLPGFDFQDIKGCFGQDKIQIKLDEAEVEFRLKELRDELIQEFGLVEIPQNWWAKLCKNFLEQVCSDHSATEKIENKKVTRMAGKSLWLKIASQFWQVT